MHFMPASHQTIQNYVFILRRSRSAAAYSHQTFPWTICRSVGLSVCPVHCGKTADRIRMPFGIVGRTGSGTREVIGFGDRSMVRGTFGGAFGARHCNQWGIYGVRVRQYPNRRSCGLRWWVRWAEALLHYMRVHVVQGEGEVLGVLFSIFTIGNAIGSPTVNFVSPNVIIVGQC